MILKTQGEAEIFNIMSSYLAQNGMVYFHMTT